MLVLDGFIDITQPLILFIYWNLVAASDIRGTMQILLNEEMFCPMKKKSVGRIIDQLYVTMRKKMLKDLRHTLRSGMDRR